MKYSENNPLETNVQELESRVEASSLYNTEKTIMEVIQKNYASIILPLAVAQKYTYEIPADLMETAEVGKRVEVQFGSKRIYAGLVKEIYQSEPPEYRIKPILSVIDEESILKPMHFKLWDWMAKYYMCSTGEIMIAALPSALKLSSQTKVLLNPLFDKDYSNLEDNEYLITEALELQNELDLDEIKKIVDKGNITYLIKSLIDKGVVIIEEELKEAYQPKMENFVSINPEYLDPDKQGELFKELSRAPKQQTLLMAYLSIARNRTSVSQPSLLKKSGTSSAQINALIKKGVFTREKQAVDRIVDNYELETLTYDLSELQKKALTEIEQGFQQKNVVLIHGVTASGKTQLYIEMIQKAIAEGKNVLYLLPEIALSGQMIARLRKVFGGDVGIYHSKFNPQERVEIWNKVLKNEYKVVVGVRSSLFLPLQNLGLIVVDEEHDPSYKQQDPAPRYNARDTAIKLATLHGAKVILGSATPSMESYANARKGKFALVELLERFGGINPPLIELVDIRQERKEKRMHSHFSQTLLEAIDRTIKAEEQVILFRNRRGFSASIACGDCGWIPNCIRCDVSLTYHKYAKDLKCHYCGYQIKMPDSCHDCSCTDLKKIGFGTEKIETELKFFFPDLQITRMDLETTRQKMGYMKILNAFEEKSIDVLVGTQMVTKGLDFDSVGLVGVLSADSLMGFPDFRSVERAFQLMLQVSGRTGRRDKQGRVLIQTSNVRHPVFGFITNEDFKGFYDTEIQERREYVYPPFNRLVGITIKHRNKDLINRAAFSFAQELGRLLPTQVLGPSVPAVSMVRNYYIRQVLLKMPPDSKSIYHSKQQLINLVERFKQSADYKGMIVQVDVDPY